MNNKGFTLIELIVVVAILGVLGTIISISLTKTLNNNRQKECEAFVEDIEEAACLYVGLNNKIVICTRTNCPPITLKTLVSEGVLDEQIDACTNNDMNLNETVSITWNNNGEKICAYNGVRNYER